MSERIAGSEYQKLHHFISESPWDHELVLAATGRAINAFYEKRAEPVGLIIDESGHKKSGNKSVGVSRQYLGSIGKTDNGQVMVFAALVQGDDVGMVNVRLYLSKEWTGNTKRCEEAGVPEKHQGFKTKLQLTMDMIYGLEGTVDYDWIGGDGAYGDSSDLRKQITALGKKYVLDIHENQHVYLEHPKPIIPDGPAGQGGIKNTYKSEVVPVKVRDILATLPEAQWKTYTYRQGTKGPRVRKMVCLHVYAWAQHRAQTDTVETLRLIISKELDGGNLKYSLTNDVDTDDYKAWSEEALLYRQMQRYWVERGIKDCKDTLGMTDYQVRTWRAFYHHITLTIMALHYMLQEKIQNEEEIPLLSCPDIKFFLAMTLSKQMKEEEIWNIISQRHNLRQKDIDRYKNLK